MTNNKVRRQITSLIWVKVITLKFATTKDLENRLAGKVSQKSLPFLSEVMFYSEPIACPIEVLFHMIRDLVL